MADNRDPRKKSRTNRNRLTSSSNRAARSRASAADTPRPTSSANRPSGTGAKVTTSGSGQGGAKVTQGLSARGRDAKRFQRMTGGNVQGDTGRIGTKNSRVGNNPPRGKTPNPRTAGGNLLRRGAAAAGTTKGAGMLGRFGKPLAGAAALWGLTEGVFTRKAGDGTLKGKPSRPNTQKPKPKAAPKKSAPKKSSGLSAGAKSFDKAFAAARKAGKSTFTWRGRSYNTKYKGE